MISLGREPQVACRFPKTSRGAATDEIGSMKISVAPPGLKSGGAFGPWGSRPRLNIFRASGALSEGARGLTVCGLTIGGADETRTRRQWRNAIAGEPRMRIALREPANDVETRSVTENGCEKAASSEAAFHQQWRGRRDSNSRPQA